jgi:hypothetical protein
VVDEQAKEFRVLRRREVERLVLDAVDELLDGHLEPFPVGGEGDLRDLDDESGNMPGGQVIADGGLDLVLDGSGERGFNRLDEENMSLVAVWELLTDGEAVGNGVDLLNDGIAVRRGESA